MIDVHSHIIPNVDDGSTSLETSIMLITEEINQGVTDIICTPHYRRHMFETNKEKILNNFNILKEEVSKRALNVNLYLGHEIYCHHLNDFNRFIEDDKIITMNNTKYVLLEFSYTNNIDITEVCYLVRLKGYIPIIAHIERYEYVGIEEALEIKKEGALIQVNATSLIGKNGLKAKIKINRYLKLGLVDFVSSDIHQKRSNDMKKAYNIILRKYGEELGMKVFFTNGEKIIRERL